MSSNSSEPTTGFQAESPDDNPSLNQLCGDEFPFPEKQSMYEFCIDSLIDDADGDLTGVHLTLEGGKEQLAEILHALNFSDAGVDDDHGLKLTPITDGESDLTVTSDASAQPAEADKTSPTTDTTEAEADEENATPAKEAGGGAAPAKTAQTTTAATTTSQPDPAGTEAASEADSQSNEDEPDEDNDERELLPAEDFSPDELVREGSPNADPTEAIGVLPERAESPEEQREAFKEAASENPEEVSVEYGTAQYWVLRTLAKFGDTLKKPLIEYLAMSDNANNLPSTIYQLKQDGLVVSFNWEQNGNQSVYAPTPIVDDVLHRSEQNRVENPEFQDTVLQDPGKVVLAKGIKIDGKDHPRSYYYDVHGNLRDDISAKRQAVAQIPDAPQAVYSEVGQLIDAYFAEHDTATVEDAAEHALSHPKVDALIETDDRFEKPADADHSRTEFLIAASDAIDRYWAEADSPDTDSAVEYALENLDEFVGSDDETADAGGDSDDDDDYDGTGADNTSSFPAESGADDAVDVHGESQPDDGSNRSDKQTALTDDTLEPADRRLDHLAGSDD